MLQKYFIVGDYDYMFRYEVPESFFDKDTLKYLRDKLCKEIQLYQDKIIESKKGFASGLNKGYWYLRLKLHKEYILPKLFKQLKDIDTKYDFKFGEKKNQTVIDINKIKEEIKCWDLLGKPEREDGNRMWYKLRDERTASCCVYKETNSFFDFGMGNGGSVLDLFMLINKCDIKEAIKALSK